MTIAAILKEIKNVPSNRLDELYQFIHSLYPKAKATESMRKKILSFAGAFSDMSAEDYKDFLKQTEKTRDKLFDRKVSI